MRDEDSSLKTPPTQSQQLPLLGNYVRDGWQLVWANPIHIGYAAVFLVTMMVLSRLGVIGQLASAVLSAPLMAGFYLAMRRQIYDQPLQFSHFFSGFDNFIPLMLVGVVSSILISIGFFLLVLPGVYLMVAYLFAIPFVADQKMDFWQAMERSRQYVTPRWLTFFVLMLVLLIANFLGMMLFGLGLLVSLPFTAATVICAYHDLFRLQPPDSIDQSTT